MVAIPTNQAELAELLADDTKRAAVFANAETSQEFLAAYAKITDRKGDLSKSIAEQVQAGIVDFMKDSGVVAKAPNLTEFTQHMANELAARKGSGAVRNAAYNPAAPGRKVEELGFAGIGDFLQTISPKNLLSPVHNADKLGRLREIKNAYSSSNPGSAGFLVPEDVRSNIMSVALESAVVRPRATVVTMGSATASIPYVDTTTNSGSVFGGMVFYWTAEAGALTESEAKFGKVKLEANKLTGYAVIPNELLDDAPALASWFNSAAPAGIAFYEDQAFLSGSGGNEPLGVYNSGAMVTVTKETGQAADTIVWENIVKMYSRMLPTSLGSAVWVVNQTCLPQLLSLSIAVGTGGAPVVTMNGTQSPTMSILGRPVLVTEKAGAIGDLNDISFIDFGYYLLGDRQSVQVDMSEHVKFATDETAMRIIERVDGRPWVQSAITPLNGSTVSPFVNLQAR